MNNISCFCLVSCFVRSNIWTRWMCDSNVSQGKRMSQSNKHKHFLMWETVKCHKLAMHKLGKAPSVWHWQFAYNYCCSIPNLCFQHPSRVHPGELIVCVPSINLLEFSQVSQHYFLCWELWWWNKWGRSCVSQGQGENRILMWCRA